MIPTWLRHPDNVDADRVLVAVWLDLQAEPLGELLGLDFDLDQLDDLTDFIQRRQLCDDDVRTYVDLYCDARPALDFATWREQELDTLDEEIHAEAERIAGLVHQPQAVAS